ncbi:MAG: metallophosphoesterase family protein [Micromonosporaceae bacterium]
MLASASGGTLKLAVVADVHLDQAFTWAGPEVGRKLRQAIRDALRSAVRAAAEAGVDAFCVAGDLFEDDRYAADTPEFLRKLFGDLSPIPVLLAPGNHDFAGPTSPYRTVEWTPNVHVFSEPELSAYPLTDGVTVWGAGHDRPAYTPGFLDAGFHVPGAGVHVALFHGAERGSLAIQGQDKQPHAPFDERQIASAGLAHAFVGHYHQPRDSALLTYPGNLERLTFGEMGERGLVLATLAADGSVTTRRQVLSRVGMYDVEVDADECQTVDEVRDRLMAKLAGLPQDGPVRVARVDVSGEVDGDLGLTEADLMTVQSDLDALVIREVRLRPAEDLEQIAGEATVRGEFVRMVQAAADLGDADRELVLMAGLRALSGRGDLRVV